jgi:two-component system LytT family sensor kinase
MPDRLSIHGPLLVNTLGHCAGAIVFGTLVYLFWLDWRRSRSLRSRLSVFAAALACIWNLGSLVALQSGGGGGTPTNIIVALSFSVLSLLPAVLLHIALEGRHAPVWISGYIISGISIALHIGDLFTEAASLHSAALLLITVGFSGLTIISIILENRSNHRRGEGPRLAGTMCLFLLAISFVHLGAGHGPHAWSGEIALHHAALPLAIFVLLHDFRFLLLDAFLRFVLNAALATAALYLAVAAEKRFHLISGSSKNEFNAALLFVAGCVLLVLFAFARSRMQRLLTQVVFLRANVVSAVSELRQLGLTQLHETEYLSLACENIAKFMWAERFELRPQPPVGMSWPQAVVPLRFSRGDLQYFLLGSRRGGRPFLSEDFAVLSQLTATLVEQVERLRSTELQTLAVQAELRELQAQINPHFLFNAFNTLYGTIARDNTQARRLVLNLADVFRYCLRPETAFIRIEEEIKIVRAYLAIEELRLGSKLTADLDVEDSALQHEIPILSLQPLVENAVKHGVAAKQGVGFVHVSVRANNQEIRIEVSNSGEIPAANERREGAGVGLANVRRRLALCYGSEANLDLSSYDGKTVVSLLIPVRRLVPA